MGLDNLSDDWTDSFDQAKQITTTATARPLTTGYILQGAHSILLFDKYTYLPQISTYSY